MSHETQWRQVMVFWLRGSIVIQRGELMLSSRTSDVETGKVGGGVS